MNFPLRITVPELDEQDRIAPQGHDAPRHSTAWSNYKAACIASREVRLRARYSEAHRQSLAAWLRGERSWPWPDATPEEAAAADEAVMGLVWGDLLREGRNQLEER